MADPINQLYPKEGMEGEANAFAMYLLMPDFLLEKHVPKDGIDLCDEAAVSALAKKFRVPNNMMAARLLEFQSCPT